MAYILIAEDEPSIADLLRINLELVGHRCGQTDTGPGVLAKTAEREPDLILLDIMLPGMDGFAVKAKLPEEIPVIFITARTRLEDRLRGLRMGADDYIVKPFEILEVLARVEAVLRRTSRNESVFRIRNVKIDLAARRAFVGEQEVDLTPQEFSLMETLILNRNLALSREQLIQGAWGYDYIGETRTVDVHIQRLRKKLNLEKEIQTVYKLGYRLYTKS